MWLIFDWILSAPPPLWHTPRTVITGQPTPLLSSTSAMTHSCAIGMRLWSNLVNVLFNEWQRWPCGQTNNAWLYIHLPGTTDENTMETTYQSGNPKSPPKNARTTATTVCLNCLIRFIAISWQWVSIQPQEKMITRRFKQIWAGVLCFWREDADTPCVTAQWMTCGINILRCPCITFFSNTWLRLIEGMLGNRKGLVFPGGSPSNSRRRKKTSSILPFATRPYQSRSL